MIMVANKRVYVGMVGERSPDNRWQEHVNGIINSTKERKYAMMRRVGLAMYWWMLPLLCFSGKKQKPEILKTEAWFAKQFPRTYNNLRNKHCKLELKQHKKHPLIVHRQPARKGKCCELCGAPHNKTFVGWFAWAGCMLPNGECKLLEEVLHRRVQRFMLHTAGPMNRSAVVRKWGHTLVYVRRKHGTTATKRTDE